MFETTLRKLTLWRNETAHKEGVDLFRVLPNKTLEELARKRPKNKAEMIEIKGIKEAKFSKYGKDILQITKKSTERNINDDMRAGFKKREDSFQDNISGEIKKSDGQKIFSVGEFWDIVNEKLWTFQARIRGEISSIDKRSHAIYFSLKDKEDESVMNCFIFRYQYEILGIELEEGMEVVIEGYPEVYKPYGRLSLRTSIIELEGEGILKKEYERLKHKLQEEGVFDVQNKKTLCPLPQNVVLITSREGAAIGDFISNVGKYGLKIRFINSNVEGKRAVFELMRAIRLVKKMPEVDALVIIRGGGSLESLQAFNNEALIRETKTLGIPIICGVGHDKDISLLSLAADYSVSTPTAAAKLIGGLWEKELGKLSYLEKNILGSFEDDIRAVNYGIRNISTRIEMGFGEILQDAQARHNDFFNRTLSLVERCIFQKRNTIDKIWKNIDYAFTNNILKTENIIGSAENTLRLNNPGRQLKLGYAVISKDGTGLKSVEEIHGSDVLKIRLWDGEVESQVIETKKFNK